MKLVIFCLMFWYSNTVASLDKEWWKHTIIYEILPFSFKDSDGDGIGDIKGIISKLDHFVDLKIETLHFTPIHETTGRDIGYDVSDFYSINSVLGTMDDFHELISEMSKRNMKLILDLVINHSSNKNEWFLKSVDRIDPYTDYYVWKDAKSYDNKTGKRTPPNNWVSLFGGSGWEWNEKRQQFYFHQFLKEQVDFNLRNPIVVEELKNIIKFWMDKGVAGFRLDAVNFCLEDKDFRDNDEEWMQVDQDDTYEFIHELRLFLDDYNWKRGGFERIFVAEAHVEDEHLLKLYGREDYPITHYPYIFRLEYIRGYVNAKKLNTEILSWLEKLPQHSVSCWMTQDHDGSRVGSRKQPPEYSDILTTVSMLLPGAVGCYYGQEIAMLDGYTLPGQIQDFSGKGTRDPARMLMLWDNSINAGFSINTTSTYLPPHTEYFSKNVELQRNNEISNYQLFKSLSNLRTTDTIKYGDIKTYVPSKFIFIFSRSYKHHVYYVIVNLSSIHENVNLNEAIKDFPSAAFVVAASVNANYQKGAQLDKLTSELRMRPFSCIVVEANQKNR